MRSLAPAQAFAPGKQTLTEQLSVQRHSTRHEATDPGADDPSVVEIVGRGVASDGGPLPHRSRIQALFGRHDISSVQAHTGPHATTSARAIGAMRTRSATTSRLVVAPIFIQLPMRRHTSF